MSANNLALQYPAILLVLYWVVLSRMQQTSSPVLVHTYAFNVGM